MRGQIKCERAVADLCGVGHFALLSRYIAGITGLWGIYPPLSCKMAGILGFWGIYTPLFGNMTGITGF